MGVPLTLSQVPSVLPYIQYIATLGQTVFPYPFPITQDSDLVVVVNGATYATDTGYVLSGQGNDTGGNVTLNVGSSAGDIITLFRDVPIERLTQISQNSGFSSTAFNAEFNNIYLIMQQLEESIALCLQMPMTNNPAPTTLLSKAAYALKYLGFDINGNPTPVALTSSGALTAGIIGGLTGPATAIEVALGVPIVNPQYPVGWAIRYGIVNNIPSAAANNATVLSQLLNPTMQGFAGDVVFQNFTGVDTCWLACTPATTIQMQNVSLNLNGCTLSLSATAAYSSAWDTVAFLRFIRDVEIKNGSIAVNFNGSTGVNAGAVMLIGSRPGYGFGAYPAGVLDQDSLVANGLPPMGQVTLRNLRITSNNPSSATSGASLIMMLGGLANVTYDTLWLNGQGVVGFGVYYEYGFSSMNGQPSDMTKWTSSHMVNFKAQNVHVENMHQNLSLGGGGIGLGGAAHSVIENLTVDTACSAVVYTPGSALFFRTWQPTSAEASKRGMVLKNIVGSNINGTGLALAGAQSTSGGYLAAASPALTPSQQVDLMDFDIINCSINAAGAGAVISGPFTMLGGNYNGTASSGQIVITDDVTRFHIDRAKIVNSTGAGLRLGLSSVAWTTPRMKQGSIENCLIAGNLTGISCTNNRSLSTRNNQIGFNLLNDAVAETTQTSGILVAQAVGTGEAGAGGVVSEGDFVSTASGVAYNMTGTVVNPCDIRNPKGEITTAGGGWLLEGIASVTSTNIATAAHWVNGPLYKTGPGRQVYDASNHRALFARGSNTTDLWDVVPNSGTTVTPS